MEISCFVRRHMLSWLMSDAELSVKLLYSRDAYLASSCRIEDSKLNERSSKMSVLWDALLHWLKNPRLGSLSLLKSERQLDITDSIGFSLIADSSMSKFGLITSL